MATYVHVSGGILSGNVTVNRPISLRYKKFRNESRVFNSNTISPVALETFCINVLEKERVKNETKDSGAQSVS